MRVSIGKQAEEIHSSSEVLRSAKMKRFGLKHKSLGPKGQTSPTLLPYDAGGLKPYLWKIGIRGNPARFERFHPASRLVAVAARCFQRFWKNSFRGSRTYLGT